eukprot:7376722-Prymnesium_polylepis.1
MTLPIRRHVDTTSAAVKPEVTYGSCGALVWVIDAQDDHAEALARLCATISTAYRVNPNIKFEIFVHKVRGGSPPRRSRAASAARRAAAA